MHWHFILVMSEKELQTLKTTKPHAPVLQEKKSKKQQQPT